VRRPEMSDLVAPATPDLLKDHGDEGKDGPSCAPGAQEDKIKMFVRDSETDFKSPNQRSEP
jgi:hypothetical protein